MKKSKKKATKATTKRRIRRSARSGKFVTEAETKKHPNTTVTETA